MSFRPSMCRSDSKIRNPINRNPAGRNSLQNENNSFKRQRSSSLDFRASRGSGSTSKPRSSSEERKSVLGPGWRDTRKSSINFHEGKLLKDTRPLTDKSYQKRKVVELIEFLNESGFQYPITLAKLMQPSKKDFEIIFQHLVHFCDPTFEVKKLEEDAPKMLKTLCYPFIPNKSAFTYVARTSWPPLLGVLLFLMDHAKFSSNVDQNLFLHSWESERPEEHAILFEYIFSTILSGSENEEEERQVFTQIIKRRMPCNIEELQQRNEEFKENIKRIQEELDIRNALKEQSQQQDADLEKYEEFFIKMKERRQKKEDICQKYSEELAVKETELRSLQDTLAKREASYDAQGFDGKKQMSYFENQKKELGEKLESKRVMFKELQNECWEAEIQHQLALDKTMTVCETFNELYSKLLETTNTILDPLKSIKDPQIKNFCSNFNFDFPDCKMQPNQKSIVQGSNARKSCLEEIKKKIDSAILIFKGLSATQNQRLHEILMKKSELSVNLKVASSEETQKERDLTSKEKQAVDDVKAIEIECNQMLKLLEELQTERSKCENEYAAKKEELVYLENVKRDKQKMLEDYRDEQKELFSTWKKDIKEAEKECEGCGEEIFEALEKLIGERKV